MTLLRLFYRFMVWATMFELAIARSTGRNLDSINHLQQRLQYWELALWELDWRM